MTLVLENIAKLVGGETHLADINLELVPGSLNVLLGPTLAGKTSLMRLMAGLDRPSSGRLMLDDRDVTGLPVRRRSIAMVYQQFINYPSFTVYENIASPLRRAGLGRAEIDGKVRRAAEALKITPLLERLPAELSGGREMARPGRLVQGQAGQREAPGRDGRLRQADPGLARGQGEVTRQRA